MTNASGGQVLFEVQDRVATITLNRPEAMNAMNRAVGQGIMEGLNRIEDDPDIRVGIITGNGRAFCAGADLKERAASGSGGGASASTACSIPSTCAASAKASSPDPLKTWRTFTSVPSQVPGAVARTKTSARIDSFVVDDRIPGTSVSV